MILHLQYTHRCSLQAGETTEAKPSIPQASMAPKNVHEGNIPVVNNIINNYVGHQRGKRHTGRRLVEAAADERNQQTTLSPTTPGATHDQEEAAAMQAFLLKYRAEKSNPSGMYKLALFTCMYTSMVSTDVSTPSNDAYCVPGCNLSWQHPN